MKLKDIIAGTRAIHRVRLPLVNVPSGNAIAPSELAAQRERDQAAAPPGQAAFSADSVEVGVRVLTGLESQEILKEARAYAEKHGSKRPEPGDPLYDFGLRLYTVALSTVDPDSDARNPEPFFGVRGSVQSAADEILSSPHIGRDGILYLSEQQQVWQDLLNPQELKVTPERLYELVGEVAASQDADPFWRLRPGMQWVFVRFMAVQLWNALDPKSSSGADSPTPSSSSSDVATASDA